MFNLYEIEYKNTNYAVCGVRVFAKDENDARLYFERHIAPEGNKFIRIIPLNLDNTVFKVINVKQYIM